MTVTPYAEPLARLLAMGQCGWRDAWCDYRRLGIGPEHVDSLVQMAGDEQFNDVAPDDVAAWAPIHAIRALGQLEAADATDDLLALLDERSDDDSLLAELPLVFGMFGDGAVDCLTEKLAEAEADTYVRVAAAEGLKNIASRLVECRECVIAAITDQLHRYGENPCELNAALVCCLIELEAVDCAPLVEASYQAGAVDTLLAGDWPSVQHQFGLAPAPVRRGTR